MESLRDQTIETLLVSVNRLIRIAAQAAGSTTSSAVWRTLGILETDQPLRLGELAKLSRVSQPTMTRLVAGMLSDDLISRTVDPDDSRGQLIEITAPGRDRLADWRATLTRTVGPMFADLDDDQWDVLHEASDLIASALGGSTAGGSALGGSAAGGSAAGGSLPTNTSTSESTRTEITA